MLKHVNEDKQSTPRIELKYEEEKKEEGIIGERVGIDERITVPEKWDLKNDEEEIDARSYRLDVAHPSFGRRRRRRRRSSCHYLA